MKQQVHRHHRILRGLGMGVLGALLVSTLGCETLEQARVVPEAAPRPASDAKEQVRLSLNRIGQEEGVLGMAAIALRGGKIWLEHYQGSAVLDPPTPVGQETAFRVASITKLVTSAALMILWEEGHFQLDDDVSIKLGYPLRNPAWPGKPITYRHLLTHASGLQDGQGYQGFPRAIRTEEGPGLQDLVTPGGLSFTPDMFRPEAPGQVFAWANMNFIMLGALIEQISGQRYDKFVTERIFRKLGVVAGFHRGSLPQGTPIASLYRPRSGEWEVQLDYRFEPKVLPGLPNYRLGQDTMMFGPHGNLLASARALERLVHVFMGEEAVDGERVLLPSTVKLMASAWRGWTEGQGDPLKLFYSYGLGMHRAGVRGTDTVWPGRIMLGHPGEAYGLVSDVYFDPQTGDGLILLVNGVSAGLAAGSRTGYYRLEERVFEALRPPSGKSARQTP